MRRRSIALALLGVLVVWRAEATAFAQSPSAPVPPDPEAEKPEASGANTPPGAEEEPKKTARRKRKVTPGFEEPEETGGAPAEPPPNPKGGGKKQQSRGRQTGLEEEEEEEDLRRPVDVPPQRASDRLIADVNASTGEVTLGELVDEILADVIAEIDARPAKWFSPMAIRQVALGANVAPSYSRKLQSAIIAQIHAGTEIRMVQCIECDATQTRLSGGEWVITRGIVGTDEMRTVADKLGVRSFMDVAFGFDPETGVLEMDFRIIRARDAYVLWSDSFRADETTPVLARSSEAPIRRKDRLKDLEMLLEGRPFYGYVATAGYMILPHNDPFLGDIGGATAGYRIYERFGVERRVMFGLDLTGFLNTSRLAGAVISAGSWWVPFRPDFINPELRLGVKAGAFIAGTAGNAAIFQLGAEVLLRYRFGLYAYVLFMTKSRFPPGDEPPTELGGVGMATGMSFNW